jgi:hypothetical protein
MTAKDLKRAMYEAKRFMAAAQAAQKKHTLQVFDGGDPDQLSRCKENAAVRRASMDLSKALSQLRKSPYEKKY